MTSMKWKWLPGNWNTQQIYTHRQKPKNTNEFIWYKWTSYFTECYLCKWETMKCMNRDMNRTYIGGNGSNTTRGIEMKRGIKWMTTETYTSFHISKSLAGKYSHIFFLESFRTYICVWGIYVCNRWCMSVYIRHSYKRSQTFRIEMKWKGKNGFRFSLFRDLNSNFHSELRNWRLLWGSFSTRLQAFKKSLVYSITHSHFLIFPSIFVHYFERLSFKLSYLFWEPRSNKGHLEGVTVRMKCVEWFRWYCTQHWKNAPRKLITNCNVKKCKEYGYCIQMCEKVGKNHSQTANNWVYRWRKFPIGSIEVN